ncbi:Beta-hydroxyacyl-(acyl-carrier-protein) dehydratase FabA/FabZ [Thermodesulfatator indicus DSM 15286]|uniref:3-hydroxyacyl-[acyl-carrier-protein] dehydratase n=1 Tax=Thermodesulfatator indicus (strain DSM 15286 / JCM 11887 / CIR29812) TaxID=667014 RepID=F8AAF9_THEID|nr:3-hydroxyacyl-ACP dehydratase FabZ [Thermodesulfatator indicus]AEH45379.1 Beta-hydroxyacyl-(acyl-carrier-protein) dehydratase FabA/FabZ [Thermodesulfatator indicus DSM 15286]
MNEISQKEILELLPHRYPFLFVDKVVKLDPEVPMIEAIKCFTWNEEFFQGHFPGEPVVPGVILVEAIAQTGIIFFKKLNPEFRERLFVFASIEKAKFRAPVYPGDVARFVLEGYKARRNILKTSGKVYVGDKLVAEADVTAAVR